MVLKGMIYWHPWIYQLAMKGIYGKEYSKRYQTIAKEVGDLEVLDLCCGDCKLSEFVKRYKGIDFNDSFIKRVKRKGLNVIKMDIANGEIPKAECIVLQDSLYQFIPHHEDLIKRILEKGDKVIISEAGIALGKSKNPVVSFIAKKLTNTSKSHPYRFTKKELYSVFKKFNAKKIIDTGRDLTGVFENR